MAKSDSFVISVCPSVRMEPCSAPTGRIFIKFDIFFENIARKFKFHEDRARITGPLHEDQYTLLIISLSGLLRMRNVTDKISIENRNPHFVFNNLFSKIVPFVRECGKI